MDNTTKALVATAVVIIVITAGIAIITYRLNSTGNIVTIGLDASINNIDWGNVEPNNTYSCTFEVTNTKSGTGMINVTTADMPSYLQIESNAEGIILYAHQTKSITIYLITAPDAPETTFSFTIILTLSTIPSNTTAIPNLN